MPRCSIRIPLAQISDSAPSLQRSVRFPWRAGTPRIFTAPRTLDLHIFNLTDGPDFATTWRVESGPAKLFKTDDTTLLSYHFDSAWIRSRIVLALRFPSSHPVFILKICTSSALNIARCRQFLAAPHRHARYAGGSGWETNECMYLAQYRPMSFILQPLTFDDESMRAKIWVTIDKTGPSPRPAWTSDTGQGIPATLRVIVTPSSTLRGNWGKAFRNYYRAFLSVPFWRYISNSLLLVVLCTIGSLFSASFVAYAFARLHWPGRSAAFVSPSLDHDAAGASHHDPRLHDLAIDALVQHAQSAAGFPPSSAALFSSSS